MGIEHRPPYEWAYKPGTMALVREAEIWAEVERNKDKRCESIDLLLEYNTYCRGVELGRRKAVPAGFCSWCDARIRQVVTCDTDLGDAPLVRKVLTRQT